MKRRNPEACQPSCWDFASAISLQGLVWVHVHQSRDLFWILAPRRKLAIPWTTCQNLPPHRQCLRYRALQRPSSGRGRKVWKMQTPSSWLFQKALARHLVLLWKVQATGVSRSMKNHDSFISVSVCLYCSCPWCRVIWNSNLDIVCPLCVFKCVCGCMSSHRVFAYSRHFGITIFLWSHQHGLPRSSMAKGQRASWVVELLRPIKKSTFKAIHSRFVAILAFSHASQWYKRHFSSVFVGNLDEER